MKKIAALLVFIAVAALLAFYKDGENFVADEFIYSARNFSHVCFKDDTCLRVEIASTPEDRVKGLMHRKGLGRGEGMLFIFDTNTRHGFWMKNMEFPIDILWISRKGKVVHIEHSVPPCRNDPCIVYIPPEKAVYVLETRANFTLEKDIEVGSWVGVYTS